MSDSRVDTFEHIRTVQANLRTCIHELIERSARHDESKLHSPEREIFDEFTGKLKESTYGSEEYKGFLAAMKPALDHHYSHNRHHPEYHHKGIQGMNLIDLLEMLCDWLAATKRHANGDIGKSIEINAERFKYGDEIKQLLLNTVPMLTCREQWRCYGCGAGGCSMNFCYQCGAGRKDYESA